MTSDDEIITVELTMRELAEIALSVTSTALDLAENSRDPDRFDRIVLLAALVRKLDRVVRARR